MSALIDRCPPEILIGFIEASEHADRRTLRSVSTTWNSLATPLAFDSLVLVVTRNSMLRMLRLMRNQLAKWAKTLELRVPDGTDFFGFEDLARPTETTHHPDPVEKAIFKILFSLTSIFPLLERFNVRFFSCQFVLPLRIPSPMGDISRRVPKYVVHHTHVLRVLSAAGQSRPRFIKSLTLHGLLPLPDPSFLEEGFKNVMESLESLTISVHRACSLDNQEYWETFWMGFLPDFFLAPAQAGLTSLSLTSDQPVGYEMPGIDLSVLHFPALRQLQLGGFCFDLDLRLEKFIVKHRVTLMSLVLDSCPMWTGDNFQNMTPKRKWSQTIARLERSLTQLIYVRVASKLLWGLEVVSQTEMILTYESSATGYGYDRGERVDLTIRRDDHMALEKLYTAVDRRRRRMKSWGIRPLRRGAWSVGGELPCLPLLGGMFNF